MLTEYYTDSKLDYTALLISAAVNYPISKRNYLYLKVDALQYDYGIIDDNTVVYTKNGNDFSFSFGWMYEFDNGLGIKAGYEVLNLGQNIKNNGFNTGISYQF